MGRRANYRRSSAHIVSETMLLVDRADDLSQALPDARIEAPSITRATLKASDGALPQFPRL